MANQNNRPTAIITGAASGIANGLAKTLIQLEWSLILADLNLEAMKNDFRDCAPERVLLRKLDVTNPDQWKEVIENAETAYGRLDYLFNIAGVTFPGYISDSEIDLIDKHIDINAKGSMYGTTLAAQMMINQGSGHIINLASLAGLAPVAGLSFYTASKFAIRGFSLAAAAELKKNGINITVIYPDLVKTPMYDYQLGLPAETTAIVFSGSKNVLTVDDVTKAILTAIRNKPLEISLPKSRGFISKIGGCFPWFLIFLSKSLSNKGIKNISKLRDGGAV